MDIKTRNTRYDALDGVRAISAIGIVLMHVLANGNYNLRGFLFEKLIPSFTNLVFLFMVISAFSMCCGYYEKVRENKLPLDTFYKKRFLKILPFFGLLSLMDVVISPSRGSVLELLANLTLCFGFLPHAGNISVIGVGWFLGVIFVFYIIFPFYCCLIGTKWRAWMALALTYLFNVICAAYFGISRNNIVYDAVYLILGGLIYLYRDPLSVFSERHRVLSGALVIGSMVIYFTVGSYVMPTLCLCGAILVYAIGIRTKGILMNRYAKFLSSISLEIYLCHMVFFRILERMGLTRCFESDVASFVLASVLTLTGAMIFAVAVQRGFEKATNLIGKVQALFDVKK